ncbi:LlaJI family restriction endonuclease [Lysinibacillus antri]|uniref:LlaJI family restriction endonuclease n=1 Tax=Lysinibacillus antri TaxID=2498145 RepID=A0A3S0RJU6_9BACI|nr:LlaJI family restriction endonuclease [Lysinibacillus antri]RUL53951.1 LlaJI family restriction endonuclease [Lysinibacillus antri]
MNKLFRKVFMVENQKRDFNEFKNNFGLEIINELLKQQIISVNDKGGNITFNFVGVVTYGNYIFCILPKYLDYYEILKVNMSIFSDIINVIKKYNKETPSDMDILTEKINDEYVSVIPIVDFLLRDFYQHNYLSYFNEIISLNGEDEIHWQKTTDEMYAFIIDNTPYYFDMYRIQRNEEIDTMVNKIHKAVIVECIERFSDILGYSFDYTAYDNTILLSDLGDKDTILYVLKSRLSLSYYDREISVIKSLIRFIENWYEKSNEVFIYGTKEFEYVWEDICKKIFKHKLDPAMPNNVWKSYDYRFLRHELKQTLIPDIVLEEKDLYGTGSLILADAKYYNIKFSANNKTIINKPGIGDVLKQFMYERALLQSKDHINKVFNILLFPTLSSDFINIIGEVSIEHPGLKNEKVFLEYKPIQLVTLSTDIMFEKYLNNSTLEIEEIERLIDLLVAYTKKSKRINYDEY